MWLGRQDSNLGSRDQNPLPYHLATPQGHGSLATVEEQNGEPDDGEDDEPHDHEPLDDDGEEDEQEREQLRRGEDPQHLADEVRLAVPAEIGRASCRERV